MITVLSICNIFYMYVSCKINEVKSFSEKQWPVTIYSRTTYRTFAINFIKLILFRNVYDLLCNHHVVWCDVLLAMCHLIYQHLLCNYFMEDTKFIRHFTKNIGTLLASEKLWVDKPVLFLTYNKLSQFICASFRPTYFLPNTFLKQNIH